MVDQVYRIGALRVQVMGLLQERRAPMTAGAIAVALGLPLWAVQAGLDAAMAVDQVEFGTLGYWAQKVPLALVDAA